MNMVKNKEAGFVSLFTVIFFMLLITVITVGFLRIMAIEQRQAIDNDLSANARAAAEAGIEEGKRALLAYYSGATPAGLRTDLATAFASGDCVGLSGSPSIVSALQLDPNGNVVGNPELNQRYTCLTVRLRTPDYLGRAQANESDIFPLKGVSDYNQIKVSWHLTSDSVSAEGDGKPTALAPGLLLPPQTGGVIGWSSLGYPTYLRVQLFGYPSSGAFGRTQLDERSRSIFLVPVAGGGGSTSFDTADPSHGFDATKGSPSGAASCSPSFTVGAYVCSATISLPAAAQYASNVNNYFLRVTPLYGQAHFRVELQNSGNPVDMNEVQPIVDSTGQSADVYRRVQARVRLNQLSNVPGYAAESANTICKNMQVADGTFFQPNTCP